MDADVVVVGGGPVGLAAALYAARAGLSVIVVEPRVGVVDKACGEGLMPGAVAALADLGVHPDGQPLAGIRYTDGRRTASAAFPQGPGRGVRRTALHGALLGAVDRAGVRLVPASLQGVDQDAAGVTLRLAGGATRLRAAHAVAADGLHSPTRRALGLQLPARGRRRHGLRQHYRVAPWTDHVEVHWGATAEAYVTPVAPDVVGVAVLTGDRGPLQEHLEGFAGLRERLAGAEAASTARGAGPLRQRAAARSAGRVLLVGDAGGYVDALTGEGLAVGLAQARAAAGAVAAGRPDDYPRVARAASWRSTALTSALLAATGPRWARRALVPTAASLPGVFGWAVGELAGTGAGGAATRVGLRRHVLGRRPR